MTDDQVINRAESRITYLNAELYRHEGDARKCNYLRMDLEVEQRMLEIFKQFTVEPKE